LLGLANWNFCCCFVLFCLSKSAELPPLPFGPFPPQKRLGPVSSKKMQRAGEWLKTGLTAY